MKEIDMTKYFDLKVGFSCNNNCVHCVVTDKKGTRDYSTQEIKDIIDTVDTDRIIGFTGGEATIRKDFFELCSYAKEKGHAVALQTNGTMFGDDEFAKKGRSLIDSVLIAIHSSDKLVHNTIVQSKGEDMYSRTLQGLKNLAKYEYSFSTQTVISKYNMSTLLDTYSLIQSISPKVPMSMTFPHPNGAAWHNRDMVVPTYSEIYPYVQESLDKWAPYLRIEAIPLCFIFPYQNNILYHYDLQILKNEFKREGIDPANKCIGGDLFDETGRIKDYSKADCNEKKKAPLCKNCVFNDICPGVWKEYVMIHHKHLDLFPVTEEMLQESLSDMKKGALIISSNIRCANTCLFCSGGAVLKSKDEIRKETLKQVKSFIDNKYKFVEISGCDPIEMPEILLESVRMLSEAGIEVLLSTHGRGLADLDFAKKLADAGVDSIRIPLYGKDPYQHSKVADINNVSGDPSSFSEALLGICNAHEVGIKIRAQTLITQHNKNDIENIFLTYAAATDDSVDFYTVGVVGISSLDYSYTRDWYVPLKDIGPYIKDLLNSEFLKERDFRVLDVPYCVCGCVDERMDNSLNTVPDLGNQEIESNMASKNNDRIPHYREKKYLDICEKCIAKDKCGGYNLNDQMMFGTWGVTPLRGEDV